MPEFARKGPNLALDPGAKAGNPKAAFMVMAPTGCHYHAHHITLTRGASGRLHAEIESFLPGKPDPARIEFGPLHKLAPSIRRHEGMVEGLIGELNGDQYSLRLGCEVCADLRPDNGKVVGEVSVHFPSDLVRDHICGVVGVAS